MCRELTSQLTHHSVDNRDNTVGLTAFKRIYSKTCLYSPVGCATCKGVFFTEFIPLATVSAYPLVYTD